MLREAGAAGPTLAQRSQAHSPCRIPDGPALLPLAGPVLLSCHSLCCLACDLPDTHNLRNWRVLTLLGQMRRLSAGSCDHDTNDFAFPKELFDGQRLQEAQALSVVHVMTQKVFQLFCTNTCSAPWNMTLLEELCLGLSEQLDDLEACPLQEAGLAETPLMPEDSTLRTYFQRISLYLQDKNHSPCAWEMVQAEIGRSLFSSTIQVVGRQGSALGCSRMAWGRSPCSTSCIGVGSLAVSRIRDLGHNTAHTFTPKESRGSSVPGEQLCSDYTRDKMPIDSKQRSCMSGNMKVLRVSNNFRTWNRRAVRVSTGPATCPRQVER